MRRRPTQNERVSRALDRYPDGICGPDFMLPNVLDGGLPITRLAARIRDLRDAGEQIEVIGERHGCALYRRPVAARAPALAPAPSVPAVQLPEAQQPEAPADDGNQKLFDLEPGRPTFDELVPPPRNAILDDAA